MHTSIALSQTKVLPSIASALPLLAERCLLFSFITVASLALPVSVCAEGNTQYGEFALDNPTGSFNSAFGYKALYFTRGGSRNTAVGYEALFAPRGGDDCTAIGYEALISNTGAQNTAVGSEALRSIYNGDYAPGSYNTAIGFQALYSTGTGGANVATGWQALYANTSAIYNIATGASALRQNTTGNYNTALGTNALYYNNGSNNVGLGYQAGQNLTTGSNNIVIGAGVLGTAGEANVTRIGKSTQKKTFVGGISGKTVASGIGVIINSSGQLGTIQSSARFKEAIKPMGKASEALLKLQPGHLPVQEGPRSGWRPAVRPHR